MSIPGEPPSELLADEEPRLCPVLSPYGHPDKVGRQAGPQLVGSPQVSNGAVSSTMASEKPIPSVAGCQESL